MGGCFLTWWTVKKAESEFKKDLLSRAMLVAGAINPSRVASLKGNEEDGYSQDYHRLKEQLWLVRQVIPQFSILYILGKRDNQIVFMVDSEIQGSEFHSRPGEVYVDADKGHFKAFETGSPLLSDDYIDKWGEWISAIVPIHSTETMDIVGVFCIDISSRGWSVKIYEHAMAPALFTVFIALVLFLFSFFLIHYEKVQKRIASTEEYMNLAIEGAGLATWEWDLKTGEIVSNDRFCQLSGYDKDDLILKLNRWHHLVHPSEKEHLQRVLESNIAGTTGFFDEEHRIRHRDGGWIWVLNRGRIMERNLDGMPLRIAGTIMDISERKKHEHAIRDSEARFRRIFEESPIGVELYSSDGRLRQVNKACREMFGVKDTQDIIGFNAYNDPNFVPAFIDAVKEGQSPRFEIAYDFDLIRKLDVYQTSKTGISYFDVLVSAIGDINKERGQEYLIHVQDITERKVSEEERISLEKRIQAAQKMESLGLLAGGVAHDFNNILGALQGFAEMSLEIVEDKMPGSTVHEYLSQVIKASSRASDLVEQILTFSRKSDSVRKPLDIAVVVKETVKMLRSSVPKDIILESSINNGCGRVLIDPVHVHQVIMNLFTNAMQAIGDHKGKIIIELSRSAFGKITSFDPLGDYVRLCIKDNGCGISKENLGKIFDPFFTTKKPGEGTGLGLSVVHGIVISCDGYVFAESEIGKGTTICVFLPESGDRDEDSITKNDTPILVDGKKPKIVLIDDEKALLEMINERLDFLGMDVTSFSDPVSALGFLRSNSDVIDLVVLDHDMPFMTGTDLAMRIRRLNIDFPLILMDKKTVKASYSAEDLKELNIEIVEKPLFFSDFFRAIRKLLDQRMPINEEDSCD